MNTTPPKIPFRCIIHGSFRQHFAEIRRVNQIFTKAGIEVIAPKNSDILGQKDSFVFLAGEENVDPRLIELLYLKNLFSLGSNGFSYFVTPEGYIGKSVSYELGIAQISNIRCFFSNSVTDHPVYIHKNSIWKAEDLVSYILEFGQLPVPQIKRNEKIMHQLWQDLIAPGSVVAVGGIIEFDNKKTNKKREILLVRTHQWGGQYSIIGEKVRRNERLDQALIRGIKEETGLSATIGPHLCTFDQIENSGYYLKGVRQVFSDNIIRVSGKKVILNDEAEEYVWLPVETALKELPIEPNARHTLEIYQELTHYENHSS